MKPYKVIENPMVGKTYYHEDQWGVYEYGEYESWAVNAGQERRTLLGSFDSEEEAKKAFPDAEVVGGSQFVDHCGDAGNLGTLGVASWTFRENEPPEEAPDWFDPEAIGERWDDDY